MQHKPKNKETTAIMIALALGIMIGTALGVAIAHAEGIQGAGKTLYVTVAPGSTLNARLAPVDGEIAARYDRGDTVDVLSTADGWAAIDHAGDTLYCSLMYLSDIPPMEEPELRRVVGNGRVRVRKSPDGEAVGWVHPGDRVQVSGWVDGWARVDGGYVDGGYLE